MGGYEGANEYVCIEDDTQQSILNCDFLICKANSGCSTELIRLKKCRDALFSEGTQLLVCVDSAGASSFDKIILSVRI